MVKKSACSVEDPGLIPESGRYPGEGHATQSSILAWRIPSTEELQSLARGRATVHGVVKSWI